ncbi:SH3 domain-containing protein [Henriciella sp.]|uniref:SH3 domain-containing protein n=1 Tax=Henriciella sp. TaxID=1968823 RepID=UPI00263790FB|nr:SH3 domain-containing protein [Henriciella sp.]
MTRDDDFMKLLACLIASACLILTVSGIATAAPEAEAVRISQFSGKPVPRFESLRYSAVHGRRGPSKDHEIVWRYERQGMPVLVVKETRDWRQIRDADGDETWVQARMLNDSRHVFVLAKAIMRKRPNELSRGVASIQKGVVAALDSCENGWCKVKADGFRGWVKKSAIWGIETQTSGL